jgi:putative transposase
LRRYECQSPPSSFSSFSLLRDGEPLVEQLSLADGQSYATICATHGVTDRFIAHWTRRVSEAGILALGDRPRSGRPDRLDPRVEAKILAKTQEGAPAPLTHWTTRRMAALIGVSHMTVAKVWQRGPQAAPT